MVQSTQLVLLAFAVSAATTVVCAPVSASTQTGLVLESRSKMLERRMESSNQNASTGNHAPASAGHSATSGSEDDVIESYLQDVQSDLDLGAERIKSIKGTLSNAQANNPPQPLFIADLHEALRASCADHELFFEEERDTLNGLMTQFKATLTQDQKRKIEGMIEKLTQTIESVKADAIAAKTAASSQTQTGASTSKPAKLLSTNKPRSFDEDGWLLARDVYGEIDNLD